MVDSVTTPREKTKSRAKGQPIRGTKQVRLRIAGRPPLRIASGVNHPADYQDVVRAIKAAGAVGRHDWLDALEQRSRRPAELVHALREVKGRADQLPAPNVLPFTEEIVSTWLLEARPRYSYDHHQMLRLSLLPLTGAKTLKRAAKGEKRGELKVHPNWTHRMEELPDVLRLERKRLGDQQKYEGFRAIRTSVLSYLAHVLGTDNTIYLRATQVGEFSAKERASNPRKMALRNIPIHEALRIGDLLPPAARPAWITMVLTGANPKELWFDGMSYDLATGHIRINGQKRKSRERLVPRLSVTWRGVTYTPTLTTPDRGFTTFQEDMRQLKVRHGIVAKAYDARRSYSTYLGKSRIDPVAAIVFMGHGSKSQTMDYMLADGGYAQDKATLTAHGKTVTEYLQDQLRLADAAELTDKLTDTAVSRG